MNGFLRDLYEELKRRRVIRAATLYAVVFWSLIQTVDILAPALDLPNSLMQILLVIFICGLPVVVALAWGFNLTPEGLIRVTDGIENAASERTLIGRRTEIAIIAVLLVIVGALYFMQARYSLFAPETAAPGATSIATPVANPTAAGIPNSIAVLPFVHFSQDQQDEYFADGVTEELLNVLSRVKALRVAARTSSFSYRGVNKKVEEIGKELNVRYILEGSVRRNDVNDTVRVTAQLIDVGSGTHLWSQTFDREFRDIFKIQDEIAAKVVDQLQVTLLAGEKQQLKSHDSANPEAMVANSMGHSEMARRTAQSLDDSVRYFKRAIAADPNYAEAWSSLAQAYALSASYRYKPRKEYTDLAQDAVTHALELEPDLGTAWASQGLVYMQEQRDEDARAALSKALDLNPSDAMAHMWYASLCKDITEQMEHYKRAFELDPRSPVAGFNYAGMLISQGREADAMQVFNNIVEADPLYPLAYMLVAQINLFHGRLDEAILSFRRVYDLQPTWEVAANISSTYFTLGEFQQGDQWLETSAKMAPEDEQLRIVWLRVEGLLARGDADTAKSLIRSLQTVDKSGGDPEYISAALASYYLGDYDSTVKAFAKVGDPESRSVLNSLKDFYLDGALAAAWSYRQLGKEQEEQDTLKMIRKEIDKVFADTPRVHPSYWYRLAMVDAIQGNRQQALLDLQRALDEGWSDKWRPGVEPALATIIKDDNFQLMMAGLEARMNLMREQLAFEERMGDDWRG